MPQAIRVAISINDMVDHVESLCRSHEIALYYLQNRSEKSYALREVSEIFVAPIKSAVSYVVALHEIGHVLGRHQESRRCMVRERWAWDWAKRNALVWTPVMEKHADGSLKWYADGGAAIVDQNWQSPGL
jgi:hypothetical protein